MLRKIFVCVFCTMLPAIVLADTVTETQILDFGILAHINKSIPATVLVTTSNSYGSGSTDSTVQKANPVSGILQYSNTQGNPTITPVITGVVGTLSCVNCSDTSCTIPFSDLKVTPSGG